MMGVLSKLILRYCKVYNKVTGYRGRVAINKSLYLKLLDSKKIKMTLASHEKPDMKPI